MPVSDSEKLRWLGQVSTALQEARKSRYPVVLVLAAWEQSQPEIWQEIAKAHGLAFLNMLEQAQQAGFRRIGDVWPTLVDWLREQAIKTGGLLVVELDVLATRWEEDGRERFYRKLLRSETRCPHTAEAAPIIIVSQLAGKYKLPRASRESGLVIDLNE
ncbi:MAG: hypothetical protein ACUVX8_04480 [Candidatus Zipacnadales bacterium]